VTTALRRAAARLRPALDRRGRPLPRLWLFTDPVRLPDPLAAASRLPAGAAVVARGLAVPGLARLAALARRRRLVLLVAGDGRAALRWPGAGLHLADRTSPARHLLPFLAVRARGAPRLLTQAAHGRAGLARGRRVRADAVILSPVFATRSHPGAPALGPLRWAALARPAGRPAVALGGVAGARAARLPRRAAGLAAIDGLAGGG
jgi:thiamine-phosphate pyrophosphorylase